MGAVITTGLLRAGIDAPEPHLVLALVICGGWGPLKAALEAYFFALLQVISINLQGVFPSIPTQIFQLAPFPIMIFTLVMVTLSQSERLRGKAQSDSWRRWMIHALAARAPAALGKP